MMPPTPARYVFQCECGGQLTIQQGKTVTCPACGCEHAWRDLYPRLDYPPPAERHDKPAGGGKAAP